MLYAHSRNINGDWHSLEDHLRGTAALAGQFGAAFGAKKLCHGAGLTHDLGKCAHDWQPYLVRRDAQLPAKPVDHKSTGALLFSKVGQWPGLLALYGHHSGMPNKGGLFYSALREFTELAERQLEIIGKLVPELVDLLGGPSLVPESWLREAELEALEIRTRMTHSSVVDADYLDTSAHFNAKPVMLPQPANFENLLARFEVNREELLAGRTPSPIDQIRNDVYEQCLAAAQLEPGIFRLPGPTGSGKTISSLGFALKHAAIHGKRRIILAVPFLTITTQNATVVRALIGEEPVIEQHSALEAKQLAKYGADNWDAPMVITTTVQLFESLLSNRPGKARKLHNLIDSVIVLDEVQAIPIRVLPVILDVLRILVRYFGVTVLLASATQPAWDHLSAWRDDREIVVKEVISKPAELYSALRRVETSWLKLSTVYELAKLVQAEQTALVIVNKTRYSRDLARLLAEEPGRRVLHLSTRMFAAHRRDILAEVHELLAAGEPFILVSTQLVEAGVDLDFPVVFRAMAPAENLLQAGGRANREGKASVGRLIVFECAEWGTLRDYETGIAKTKQYFQSADASLDDPNQLSRYYKDFYATSGVDHLPDAVKLNQLRTKLSMQTVAKEFRMISDDSRFVVVAEAPGAKQMLEKLAAVMAKGGVPSREDWRRLQDCAVNLPNETAAKVGMEQLPGVLVSAGCYDWFVGIDEFSQDSIW